jgi:hypothetical protein
MLLTQKRLRQIIGALWLFDGLLQLQPQMFTMNMVNGVMAPIVQSQPGLIASNLQWVIDVTTHNLVLVNLMIAVVQIILGLVFLSGRWIKGTVIASIVWSLIVWYAGEGMSMLFTGQAGVLTGAPGAVLLYPLLGLLIYPRRAAQTASSDATAEAEADENALLPRSQFHWYLAGFWFLAALLQLQPYWWQAGQISQAIGGMLGQGGINAVLVDPLLSGLASASANIEVSLNIILIVVFIALGIGLAVCQKKQLRSFLLASIVVSAIIWWGAQAFGMIFTGMATDFNSGLLLIIMALACWPKASLAHATQESSLDKANQPAQNAPQTV